MSQPTGHWSKVSADICSSLLPYTTLSVRPETPVVTSKSSLHNKPQLFSITQSLLASTSLILAAHEELADRNYTLISAQSRAWQSASQASWDQYVIHQLVPTCGALQPPFASLSWGVNSPKSHTKIHICSFSLGGISRWWKENFVYSLFG